MHVKEVFESPQQFLETSVFVEGLLLGKTFQMQFIADTIEGFDQGIGLPLVDNLFDQLVDSGVPMIGGGDFSFWYRAVIRGRLVSTDARGFRYGFANIESLAVNVGKREIAVVLR